MSDNISDLDLTTTSGVLSYLTDSPFASTAVTELAGGYGNYVYRLHLCTPYDGQPTLVLKHAKPHVRGMQSLAFPVERQVFETAALQRVKAWLPTDSLVTVPTLHLHDDHAHMLIMADAGEHAISLKQLMLERPPSAAQARQIGCALGAFLGGLHAWGRRDAALLDFFEGNAAMRAISVYATYGRLVDTLAGGAGVTPPQLMDPMLEVPRGKMDVLRTVAAETARAMDTTRETFVMGDFWPGNVLIAHRASHDPDGYGEPAVKRIYVVDWELAKPGLAGLDVGQFCAELHLLRRFKAECAESVTALYDAFLEGYRSEGIVEGHAAQTALVHVGVHLAVWTARNPSWESRDTTRAVVEEGVDYVIQGYSGSVDDVRKSVVGGLLVGT